MLVPRSRAVVALARGRGRARRRRAPARRRRRGDARRDARAGVAPPAASRARDGDAALARAGGRRRCAPTTPARPARRPSCSTRSATAGIPCVGLWAQVPQYVAGSPSPPAVRALLARLAEVYRLDLDLRALDERSRRVPRHGSKKGSRRGPTSRRSSTSSIADGTPSRPSGDELVDEIETVPRDPNPRTLHDLRTMSRECREDQRDHGAEGAAPTSWSSGSRTAPARCRRCRASRRSSCCARPTTATRSSCTRAGDRRRTSTAWLNSQAFQHGHKAAQHAGPGGHRQRAVVVRRRAARRAGASEPRRDATRSGPRPAHRSRRAVRDRRRGRPRHPDAGLQAAHDVAARAHGAERDARADVDLVVQGDAALHVRRARRGRARCSRRRWPSSASSAATASRCCSANIPEWVITFWACAMLGAVLVPLNAWWKAEELEFGLVDSEAKVLIGDAKRCAIDRATGSPEIRELEHVFVIGADAPDGAGAAVRGARRRRTTRAMPPRRRRRGRPARDPLHVGHDRAAEGRDAHAPPGDREPAEHHRAAASRRRCAARRRPRPTHGAADRRRCSSCRCST